MKFNKRQANAVAHNLAEKDVLSARANIYFHIVLVILLLMKCYKYLFLKKKNQNQIIKSSDIHHEHFLQCGTILRSQVLDKLVKKS